jgi:hypothetical protein
MHCVTWVNWTDPRSLGSSGDGVDGVLLITTARRPAKAMSPAHRRVWFSHPSHPSLARRHRQASATLAGRRVWSCATFTFADRPWGESLFGVVVHRLHITGQAVDTGGRDRE